MSYSFALFNEMTMDRAWIGEMYLVAVYKTALFEAEVKGNFEAGVSYQKPKPKETITLAWDANTTEPLPVGYKIYAGEASRMNSSSTLIDEWCAQWDENYETCEGDLHPIEECKENLNSYPCPDENDQACYKWLFVYDRVVDAGNVTEFTWSGFEAGKTYYFAATAYIDDCLESQFSNEIEHTFAIEKPGINPASNGKITVRINIGGAIK
jgi:hypothetical protein